MLVQLALVVLAAMLVVMLAAWVFGLVTSNGGWTDVFWTWGTGATLTAASTWAASETGDWRPWIVPAMTAAWGLRLGLYLTPRVANGAEDARYAAFREGDTKGYPLKMLFVSLPQAPATALLALSPLAAVLAPPAWPHRYELGLAVFLLALAGEAIADGQMKQFRADPAHRGQVMDRGLWAWSRHPNYFFQWMGWLAYPVIAFDPAQPVTWFSFAAPAVMYGLLRYVSGVPPLEASMEKSRGEAFRDYQRRVSVFVPLPPKRVPVA